MSYHYADPPQFQYAPAPAPPPRDDTYVVPPPPPSAFSPHSGSDYYPPPSPLIVAAEPPPSAMHSRSNSHSRGEYISGERGYLAPGGFNALNRSGSERGRRNVGQVVDPRRALSRPRSERMYDPVMRREKYYIESDAVSLYSTSSYGGPGDSRDHSRDRRRRAHSRTPSCGSDDSYDGRYAVGMYNRPSRQEEELTEKLKEVQKQLEKVQVDAEKKRMQDEQARLEKLRAQEIERKVQEQLQIQKHKEEEKKRKEEERLQAEKKRIADAAKQLLEQQAAAAAAAKAAKEKEEAHLKAKIDAALQEERSKYNAAQSGKKTYTRFSKTHLCKEALEERGIPFTEEADYFLVHRFVEKTEQQYLWNRTKEIRNYYRQIQEAADKAPTVPGPHGGYVKYVQIAGQPYPMALPVTITRMPGGGQTQHVDPIKIKWSDIFKSK